MASPLIRQTFSRLTGGDPKASADLEQLLMTLGVEDIYELGSQLGVPGEKLIALKNGVPLQEEDFPVSDENYLKQQRQLSSDEGLTKRIDDVYAQQYESGKADIDADFGDQRRRAIEEEAALGRLRSPASIPVIAGVDNARSKALSTFRGQLGSQRAGQEFGLSQYIDQASRNALQTKKQNASNTLESARGLYNTRRGLDLQERGMGNQLMLGINQLNNDRILREKAMEPREPHTLDYLNTAFGGARAGANVWSAYKGGKND